MQCPKCEATMEEHSLSTLKGQVTVDRCNSCRGLWFDIGEAEALKEKWMSAVSYTHLTLPTIYSV